MIEFYLNTKKGDVMIRCCFTLLLLVVSVGCGKSGENTDTNPDPTVGQPDPVAEAQAFVSEWQVADGGTVFLPLLEKTADMEDSDKCPSFVSSLPAAVKRVNYNYNFIVDWGDGSTSQVTSFDDPDTKHTYAKGGKYTVKITGQMEAMRCTSYDEHDDKSGTLLSVSDLGDIGWKALFRTFAESFNLNAISGGDVAEVEIMVGVFYKAYSLNPDVGDWDTAKVVTMRELFMRTSANPDVSKWDTSSVTDMGGMFQAAFAANPDVSKWDTSSVTDMGGMFHAAFAANPDVSKWDTSSVTDMGGMFYAAVAANPDVSKWDTSSVTDMSLMFMHAGAANPDVSKWDTSSVTDMGGMFQVAVTANPDVSKWDTSKVESMSGMFKRATSAQPDMSNWNFAKIEYLSGMFAGVTLTSANYTSLLQRLQATATANEVTLDAGKSDPSDSTASAAKTALLTDRDWTIHDKNNVAASEWEIVMDTIIKESSEGVFDVTVKIEDQWGNKPSGTVKVLVALDELDRLNGTTVINTTNGVAEFTNLSPKPIAGISFPSPIKVLGKLEVGATLPDGEMIYSDGGVILTFK